MAKVKKNGIEIVVDDIDLPRYLKAGWTKKREFTPEFSRQRYELKKGKGKANDTDEK